MSILQILFLLMYCGIGFTIVWCSINEKFRLKQLRHATVLDISNHSDHEQFWFEEEKSETLSERERETAHLLAKTNSPSFYADIIKTVVQEGNVYRIRLMLKEVKEQAQCAPQSLKNIIGEEGLVAVLGL